MMTRNRQFYERMSVYTDIHRLRESGHRSIQWIANYMGLNFRTVRKYLKMSLEEYERYAAGFGQKPRTVYNTVMEVRQEWNIPKVSITERDYQMLPESPSGQYAQVDFGQKKLRKGGGSVQKVYFMAMLLCRSRQKYVWFQDHPFTSEMAVIAHEKAFEYFHGIPKEIIYDQDAVFL